VVWKKCAVAMEIIAERERQGELKAAGRFKYTCADPELSSGEKLAVLAEEVGEVARALLEASGEVSDVHGQKLRDELIQVAAVAMAWAEGLG
jgi:NTP pyrophosphatase (non-canonical NTP hydrolase)